MSQTYSMKDSSCIISNLDRRSASCSSTIRNPMRPVKVQRWAGLTRTASEWDGLRRDPELWFDDGDCLIHLYALGQSRRGPSFCVPFKALKQTKCGSMFSLCYAQITALTGLESHASTRGRVSGPRASPPNKVELYVPAPDDTSREESFRWHITTRNFFAFIFGKPLVGTHLGQAFIDLHERMHLFRSGRVDNQQNLLDYADHQGYRDFVDCPDYALAMLYYAEHYRNRDLWIDAFAHCVGMNESLALSQEFAPQSRLTKALITRAYLEMDIQLSRATAAVRNFLEDDLSPAYLGLTEGLRTHLDRFRSFLRSFYVDKFGYWPPPKGSSFSKVLYRSLYFDFKSMYDYLVDSESTADLASQKLASGGICVLQNVDSFDKRLKFPSLPHPLPLLPSDVASRKRTESQKSLRALTLGSKQVKTERYLSARQALTEASNSSNISLTNTRIIQEYMYFERQCAMGNREEKVSLADARKVRWLLIYGTLQYLMSALRAPAEVRDTEPDYPLCCLITEPSPWEVGMKVSSPPSTHSVSNAINHYLSESTKAHSEATSMVSSPSAIEPDCQTHDYLHHTNTDHSSRPISVEVPAPLKINRPSSIRSLRRLSLQLTSSRNTPQLKPQFPSESSIQGCGPDQGKIISASSSQPSSRVMSRRQSLGAANTKRSSRSTLPEGAGPDTSWLRPITPVSTPHSRNTSSSKPEIDTIIVNDPPRTPVIDSFVFDELITPVQADASHNSSSSSGSTASEENTFWSDEASLTSSTSSAHDEQSEPKISPAEESGLLGGLVDINDVPVSDLKKTSKSPRPTSLRNTNKSGGFRFSFDKPTVSFPESQSYSLDTASTDPAIGIALSAPPAAPSRQAPTPPAASLSVDNLTLTHRIWSRTNSLRSRTTSFSKYTREMSPLRMNPPSPVSVSKEESRKDFQATFEFATSDPIGRSGSETPRSILEAIPPQIPRAPKNPKMNSKITEDEERGRKKERRLSFWKR